MRVVELRARTREAKAKLDEMCARVLGSIDAGAHVEPGVIRANVQYRSEGARRIAELLIDVRPAEDLD